MATMKVEIELNNELMQKYIDEAINETKLDNGLTVAECVELQNPKIPQGSISPFYKCPKCGNALNEGQKHCDPCGQALDWS